MWSGLKTYKNWLLALFGSADLAADKTPLVYAMSVNSDLSRWVRSASMTNDKLNSGLFELPNFTSQFEP